MIPGLRNVVVIDCETGGLNPLVHAILQVALIGPDGKELTIDVRDVEGEVTARALEVNKIDLKKHMRTAVGLITACDLIDEFLEQNFEGDVWVGGHHVAFDIGFVRRLYRLADRLCPMDTYKSICTKSLLFAELANGRITSREMGLGAACKLYDIKLEGAHTALGDARATRELLSKLVIKSGIRTDTFNNTNTCGGGLL